MICDKSLPPTLLMQPVQVLAAEDFCSESLDTNTRLWLISELWPHINKAWNPPTWQQLDPSHDRLSYVMWNMQRYASEPAHRTVKSPNMSCLQLNLIGKKHIWDLLQMPWVVYLHLQTNQSSRSRCPFTPLSWFECLTVSQQPVSNIWNTNRNGPEPIIHFCFASLQWWSEQQPPLHPLWGGWGGDSVSAEFCQVFDPPQTLPPENSSSLSSLMMSPLRT